MLENREFFSEALAIAWCVGSHTNDAFLVRHRRKEIPERFYELVPHIRPVRKFYDKQLDYHRWEIGMFHLHPFVQKLKEVGWTPIFHEQRNYPTADIDHEIFIKTYIRIRHSYDVQRDPNYLRPRLRIHTTLAIAPYINELLARKLDIQPKRPQKHKVSDKMVVLFYTSKKEVPLILEYVEAKESLEKFDQSILGWKK
jgi:hypothetical protein